MTNDPTDAEILDLWESFVGEPTEEIPLSNSDKLCFARAALRSWGQPSGAVDWIGASSHHLIQQPTQAAPPAGREPLTPEQVAEIADAAHREYDRLVSSGQCAPRWSAVFAYLLEQHHGIGVKGKEAGMPDLSTLTERGAKAWAGVDAQALREDGTT